MSLSMYQASVPALTSMLTNLKAILARGAAHAEAKKIDPAALLTSRLFPDMFTLTRQVQIATDMAKGCPSRLAGMEPPRFEDTEASFAELAARIDRTIAHLKSFSPEQIDGSEQRDVTINTPRGPLQFKGQQYLQHFVLPNFYFHVTTAYNLLRHGGVELGKLDYLGAPRT